MTKKISVRSVKHESLYRAAVMTFGHEAKFTTHVVSAETLDDFMEQLKQIILSAPDYTPDPNAIDTGR